MNYQKIYDALIERARGRFICGYVEKHHIRPVCMGGTNEAFNLVSLTPEEHFLAHQLLVKIYPNKHGLLVACQRMAYSKNYGWVKGAKFYGWIRRRIAILPKDQILKSAEALRAHYLSERGEATRKLLSAKQIDIWGASPERREEMSIRSREMWQSEQYRERQKEAISKKAEDRWSNPEFREKFSKNMEERKAVIVTCPHCGASGSKVGMGRWHFNNCKDKQ